MLGQLVSNGVEPEIYEKNIRNVLIVFDNILSPFHWLPILKTRLDVLYLVRYLCYITCGERSGVHVVPCSAL